MKSMAERAKTIAINGWHQSTGELARAIIKALEEQDKITRAACVDSVNNCRTKSEVFPETKLFEGCTVVDIDEVRSVIMNTHLDK